MTWEEQAECRLHPASWWFSETASKRELAKGVCAVCPVAESCLAGALERKETYGIWAGRDFRAKERERQYRALNRSREQKIA